MDDGRCRAHIRCGSNCLSARGSGGEHTGLINCFVIEGTTTRGLLVYHTPTDSLSEREAGNAEFRLRVSACLRLRGELHMNQAELETRPRRLVRQAAREGVPNYVIEITELSKDVSSPSDRYASWGPSE